MAMSREVKAGLFVESMLVHYDRDEAYMFRPRLLQAGFKILGEGCYGFAVLNEADGMAIKVCNDMNDGYPVFAEYAKANPHPNIAEIFYTVEVDGLYFAAMPVYRPDPGIYINPDWCDSHARIVECAYNWRAYGEDEVRNHSQLSQFYHVAAALSEVIDKLGPIGRLDLHGGNFLIDPRNNAVVLTDPIAGLRMDSRRSGIDKALGRKEGRKPAQFEFKFTPDLDLLKQGFEVPVGAPAADKRGRIYNVPVDMGLVEQLHEQFKRGWAQ